MGLVNDISIYNRGVRYVYDLLSTLLQFYHISTLYGHRRAVGLCIWYGGGMPVGINKLYNMAMGIICYPVTRTVKIIYNKVPPP